MEILKIKQLLSSKDKINHVLGLQLMISQSISIDEMIDLIHEEVYYKEGFDFTHWIKGYGCCQRRYNINKISSDEIQDELDDIKHRSEIYLKSLID